MNVELKQLYFYTATIRNWNTLLKPEKYKNVLLESWTYLSEKGKIRIYAFVIMPNHIHLIWELLAINGKEMPNASFTKYTAHRFLRQLRVDGSDNLSYFGTNQEDRAYNFWIEKPLPKLLYTPEVIYQKLDYIHNNPCQGKWMLAESPEDYRYSSASFYHTGTSEFQFLCHIGDRL